MPAPKAAKAKTAAKPPHPPPPSAFRWFFAQVFGMWRRHGNFVVGCGLIGYCVHEVAGALGAFAGRQSLANLNFGVFANLNFVFTLSFTLSGTSIGLYLRERSKHRETRERLSARTKELELRLDPSRTSSHLTTEGLTRRDDV